MNILIVSPKFHPVIGGGETYVLNTARKLSKYGWKVCVAAAPHAKRRKSDYDYAVHEVPGLDDDSLDIYKAISGLSSLIGEVKPDAIHAHGYFALLAVGLSSSQPIPIIASIHSTPVWGERITGSFDSFEADLSFVKNVVKLTKPRYLTVGNEVYEAAAKKVVEGNTPLVTLPYPVDTEFFKRNTNKTMRAEFRLSPHDKLITIPSRIIRRKGILEAVIALDYLPKNYKMCLPGAAEPLDSGYWREVIDNTIFQKVRSRIIIPNKKILYDDLPSLYASSDIVAMPSYYEGSPLAPLEAMSVGKPVVAADVQGLNSAIRNKQNGLLVPVKDSFALAQAIQNVLENGRLREQLIHQALLDVQQFSWKIQLPRLIELFE